MQRSRSQEGAGTRTCVSHRWKIVVACAGLVSTSTLSACVGPARTFAVYEAKAVVSVEQASSAVQTVRVASSLALADRNFAPYLSETMHDAEEDVTTAEGHFSSIQPPDARLEALRSQAKELLTRASDAVERARIAMRASDAAALSRLSPTFADLVSALNDFVNEHR